MKLIFLFKSKQSNWARRFATFTTKEKSMKIEDAVAAMIIGQVTS